jgi:hypothetical protein
MAKKKPAPADQPSTEEPEQTFAQIWDACEPGSRLSKGVYSIYKTDEGGLHIAYRPEGDEEDSHMPIPNMMMSMLVAATEGKGPLGRMKALAMGRFGG